MNIQKETSYIHIHIYTYVHKDNRIFYMCVYMQIGYFCIYKYICIYTQKNILYVCMMYVYFITYYFKINSELFES